MTDEQYRKRINFLSQYRALSKRIDRLVEEKDKWWRLATKKTTVITDMPHGGNGENQMEIAVEKIIECEHKIDDSIDDKIKKRIEIQKAIDSVEDENLKLLLEYRYIDGKEWWEISKNMNYDYTGRNIYKLHSKAIAMVKWTPNNTL